jgi:mannose-1-phosphate guanylyltransferase/mannose-6-phosphate isomerase
MGLHILVLAGGSGTRLWPLSRSATPKHLLPLAPGGRTLLRDTVERVNDLGDAVHVVTAASQADACLRELTGFKSADPIIAEPAARGTGPALALAVTWIAREDPDALVCSVHADARVADPEPFRAGLLAAAGWAGSFGGLATVGLAPTFPSTGLGYIELGEALQPGAWRPPQSRAPQAVRDQASSLAAFRAAAFVEKPDRARAEQFVADGRHLWNLALFAWRAPVFLAELRSAAPQVAAAVESVVEKRAGGDEPGAAELYSSLSSTPVEPLVLERGAPLIAVRADFPWSDVGSWADLHDARVASCDADPAGNVRDGDALIVGSHDCTVIARGGRLVTVVGGESLVVVDTPDALLVVPADQSQRVKDAVEQLRAADRDDVL